MEIRPVKLNGGPSDGLITIASHDTAICRGEIYVWDGGEDKDCFTHALTAIQKLPHSQQISESILVEAWMNYPGSPSGVIDKHGKNIMLPAPMAMCTGIPPWRINAWHQLFEIGQIPNHYTP